MLMIFHRRTTGNGAPLFLTALMLMCAGTSFAADAHTTNAFSGVKVNGGTVTHSKQGDKNVLTLSDDFKGSETPDPHWQVVDSKGNVYQLDRLQAKNGKYTGLKIVGRGSTNRFKSSI